MAGTYQPDVYVEQGGTNLVIDDDGFVYFGDGKDMYLRWDGTDFDIVPAADDAVIKFGNGTLSTDVWLYGNTASDYVEWDASASALTFQGAAYAKWTGATQNPINMDSIGDWDTASSGSLGNVIKMDLTGTATHTATTAGLIVKNYLSGETINGNYECSAIIGYLKHAGTMAGGAKTSLMSLHRHSSSSGTVDYGIRIFTATSKLTTFLYGSGTMTNFLECVAAGACGSTVASATYSTAEGYLTIIVGGSTYRMPFYSGAD